MRIQRNSGDTSTNSLQLASSIETINSIPFAGKAVTVSFYARAGSNFSATSNQITMNLYSGTGTDQNYLSTWTGSATPAAVTPTLTTTWQRFVATGTVASTATELSVYFVTFPTGTAGTNDYFEVTGVQIDLGTYTATTAPAFRRSGGTVQGELAACQRYYWRVSGNNSFGVSIPYSSQNSTTIISLPVPLRVTPSSVDYSNVNYLRPGTGTVAVTNISIDGILTNVVEIRIDTSSGLTSGAVGYVQISSGYLGLSAEL